MPDFSWIFMTSQPPFVLTENGLKNWHNYEIHEFKLWSRANLQFHQIRNKPQWLLKNNTLSSLILRRIIGFARLHLCIFAQSHNHTHQLTFAPCANAHGINAIQMKTLHIQLEVLGQAVVIGVLVAVKRRPCQWRWRSGQVEYLAAGVPKRSSWNKASPDISKSIQKSTSFSNVEKNLQVFYLCRKCLHLFAGFKLKLPHKITSFHLKNSRLSF